MSHAPDVAVIGAGVIGLAVAREIASRGFRVVVLERSSPAREATWAAAGMLSPLGEASDMPHLRAVADASLDLWPDLAARLRSETGVDVEYRAAGALHIATDEPGARRLEDLAKRAGEGGARQMSGEEVRRLEPAIGDTVQAGLWIDRDHRVDNRRLGPALWASAHAAGAEFRLGAPVRGIVTEGDRAVGVALGGGGILPAGAVVVAAGARAAELTGLPAPLPIRPVRGQMFAVRGANGHAAIAHVVVAPGCYLVPRQDGRTLVGATVEHVGFEPGPTPEGIAGLIGASAAIVPAIRALALVETWAGYRPGTPDDRPILGPDPDVAGVFHATGHFRNGILLAPVTARLTADAVAGTDATLPIEPFSVARFRP